MARQAGVGDVSVSELKSRAVGDPFAGPEGELLREALHDIRQPLAAVFALAECVRSTPGLPPEASWYLDQLIEQVSETAKVARSALERPPAARILCFGELLASVVGSFAVTWNGRLIRVGFQGAVPVRGSWTTLRRCLVNLLDNATHAAGPQGTVLVTLHRGREQVRVLIEDDGPGFGRVVPRTGLGLKGTRRALVSLGGSISVGQREDQLGARAVLTLPLAVTRDSAPASVR